MLFPVAARAGDIGPGTREDLHAPDRSDPSQSPAGTAVDRLPDQVGVAVVAGGVSASWAGGARPQPPAGTAVDRLPDQVGVAVVAGVLLDQVHEDPAQREGLARVRAREHRLRLEARPCERVVDDGVRTTYRRV